MPGFLHNTCAVMRRETGRITRQPMYFVLMIVLPVVSFAFFALISVHLLLSLQVISAASVAFFDEIPEHCALN